MERPNLDKIKWGPDITDLLQADALGKLGDRLNKRKNWLVTDQEHQALYDMGIGSGLADCNRLKVPVEDILEILSRAPRIPKQILIKLSPPEPIPQPNEGP